MDRAPGGKLQDRRSPGPLSARTHSVGIARPAHSASHCVQRRGRTSRPASRMSGGTWFWRAAAIPSTVRLGQCRFVLWGGGHGRRRSSGRASTCVVVGGGRAAGLQVSLELSRLTCHRLGTSRVVVISVRPNADQASSRMRNRAVERTTVTRPTPGRLRTGPPARLFSRADPAANHSALEIDPVRAKCRRLVVPECLCDYVHRWGSNSGEMVMSAGVHGCGVGVMSEVAAHSRARRE